MATTSQFPEQSSRPGVTGQINRFWQRVTAGLELSQLWDQFRAEARSSFQLYKRDFNAHTLGDAKKGNRWHTIQEFAWAFLEKLTPARRVLFLLGMVLLIVPEFGYKFHSHSGEVQVANFSSHFYGGLLLFILLLLEISDRVVMKRDLEIARDIQSWLLPATPPQISGLQLAFATRPANTVAGDYYDVFPRPAFEQSHFLIVVADVAGKSIPAALLMATMQASLRTLSATSATIAELADGLNRYACTNSQGGLRYTTAFLAEFDPHSRTLTYLNAGHNNPVLRRASGAIERLSNGGLPLGIKSDAPYESGSVVLQSGDWLLIFTDGLVEATNFHDEEYGETRMMNVLNSGIAATPNELLRRMMSDLDVFVGPTAQHDDVTCLLIKVD
jgi:phosphoserine phosphatase RsbU/P